MGRSPSDPVAEHAGPQTSVQFRVDFFAGDTAENVRNFQQALAENPTEDLYRVSLLAGLGIAESFSVRLAAQARETLAEVGALAERLGTASARVYVLLADYLVDLSPEKLDRRTELANEALELLTSPACEDLREALLPAAHFMWLGALFENGDMRAIDEALSSESLTLFGQDVLESHYSAWLRCSRASMNAHISLAEELAESAYGLARQADSADADAIYVGQIAIIRWMQGRLSEMEPRFLQARQADPTEPIWAAALAWIWWQQGRWQAARGLIESLTNLQLFRQSRNWLAAIAILAEVAADIASDEFVERLRQLLEPFKERIIPLGLGISSWGTIARALALLARRQGRTADAIALFESAIATASRLGAHAWLALSQVQLATVHYEEGDRQTAFQLASESVTAARNLGLRYTEQLADRLLEAVSPEQKISALEFPVRPTVAPVAEVFAGTGSLAASYDESSLANGVPIGQRLPRITVFDEFTVTSCRGTPAAWKSQKARTLLKILLARRGAALARETAMEMLWPGEEPATLRNRFSVAITTIRKALDPEGDFPSNTFVVSDSLVLRLRMERLSIDVEDFFAVARTATSDDGPTGEERMDLLHDALDSYSGQVFAGEPYAAWAEQLRRQAHLAFFALAHAAANYAGSAGNYFEQVEIYRRILLSDPYDQRAHDGLIAALQQLGATSYVRKALVERRMRMAELGIADDASLIATGS